LTNIILISPLDARRADDLLVKSGYGHPKTPSHPGHDLCPCGQLERDTVDRFFFHAIKNSTDDSVLPDSVETAVFFADALGARLPVEG
jgi:hypothetical protein